MYRRSKGAGMGKNAEKRAEPSIISILPRSSHNSAVSRIYTRMLLLLSPNRSCKTAG